MIFVHCFSLIAQLAMQLSLYVRLPYTVNQKNILMANCWKMYEDKRVTRAWGAGGLR